jgi:SAM-dependent methyltransferase
MSNFYDELTPLYHLIFQDWDASIRRQGEQFSSIIKGEWPESKSVLDVSCGIGTQAIALSRHGYTVVGSDLSTKEIARAKHEASNRSADIAFSVCDMRSAYAHHGNGFGGEHYDLSFFITEQHLASGEVKTHVMRSRYYAISISRILELMRQAGFLNVRRIDGMFYQPVLLGTKGR